MTEETILQSLSDRENELLKIVKSTKGLMEDIEEKLKTEGVFTKYDQIHSEYLNLLSSGSSQETKIESLKRGVFLNWYSFVEPVCFTGLGTLNKATIIGFYQALENVLNDGSLDEEFLSMLAYYSKWDYAILTMAEDKIPKITSFVKSVVQENVNSLPSNLAENNMKNRGQMGDYWRSVIESWTRHQNLKT